MRRKQRKQEEEAQREKAEQDAKQIAEEKEQRQLEEKGRKSEEEAKQKAKEEGQKRLTNELQKAEEESKRIKEEDRRKVQEEEQRRKAEKEARARTEKEEQVPHETEGKHPEEKQREADNGHRKAEEARKRAEKESQQKKEEARGRERHLPLKRGGRPRGPIKRHEIGQTPGTKPCSLKPEIVCWNEGWRWIVGIEVPEELEILSVIQNEELLEQDNIDESRYRLKHAEGAVKATWTGGGKDIPLVGVGRNYFVFKMRKGWKGLGRLVKRPSTGYYLAIVPQEWKRDEEVSGPAPDAPESVQVEGYKAHFFYQEQNTVIGFVTGNGKRIRLESGGPRFQLVGREIGDASEDMGPLFGEQTPSVGMIAEQGWSDVGVIVVGEEGGGQNRWRTQFLPQVDAKEHKLPEEIANRRGGWYFLRIYDNDDNLIESMDFRFMMALNDINMEKPDCLPGTSGYNDVIVQFLHKTDCKPELMDEDIQHALEIRRESGKTIVTIPPKPDCDKTHWILRDGDAEVEVTVLVERIWWALEVAKITPTDWVNKPITLFRKDFTATTEKALWMRFPHLRFVRKINLGFDRSKSRNYQVEVEEKEITIALRDFCDAQEIETRQEEIDMKIWVQPGGAKTYETVIVKVPAEAPPLVEPKQRQVQKSISKGEKVCLLQVIVKSRRGKRKGKGFSKKELTRSAIAMEDVKRFGIPYDKRRKTSHSWNIESLKHLMRVNKHD